MVPNATHPEDRRARSQWRDGCGLGGRIRLRRHPHHDARSHAREGRSRPNEGRADGQGQRSRRSRSPSARTTTTSRASPPRPTSSSRRSPRISTTKRQVFALIDRVRAPGSIVATVSSGLSIAAMCAGQSDDFRKHFLGIHLFNPPTIIARLRADPARRAPTPASSRRVKQILESDARPRRRRVRRHAGVRGKPHRLQGAQRGRAARRGARRRVHGPARRLAHRPRALAARDDRSRRLGRPQGDRRQPPPRPRATSATRTFELPAYMQRGIERGHLGRKTRDKGGFFRVEGKGADAEHVRARSGHRRLSPARGGRSRRCRRSSSA